MAQQDPRHYHGSDNVIVQKCRVIHQLFAGDDLARFTALDPDFDAAYASQWLTDIDAAGNVTSDETLQDQQKQLSQTVETAMEAGRDKWSELKLFVKKTFPGNQARLDEYGDDNYRQARNSQTGLIKFLKLAHQTAVRDHAALNAKHYSDTLIAEIGTLATNLENADLAQEAFKKGRPVLTADRIDILNKPYDTCMAVCKTAQVVFIDNPAKQKQYIFDPSSHPAPADFSGNVAPGEVKVITTLAYVPGKHIQCSNTGTDAIQFMLLQDTNTIEGNIISLPEGASANPTMGEINGNTAATKLCVRGAITGTGGGYSVHIGD